MRDPLSSDVVASLKTDPTAALAAIMIISNAHGELLAWAQRSLSQCCEGISREVAAKTAVHAAKRFSNGPRAKGHHSPREAAAEHDEALLALMRANPNANVTELIRLNGRPRNSTMLSLERLEKGDLVEHQGRGRWVAVDPALLEAPAPKPANWVAPLSSAVKARHAADGRVRDELTMA
jgi:hypothetical protein